MIVRDSYICCGIREAALNEAFAYVAKEAGSCVSLGMLQTRHQDT